MAFCIALFVDSSTPDTSFDVFDKFQQLILIPGNVILCRVSLQPAADRPFPSFPLHSFFFLCRYLGTTHGATHPMYSIQFWCCYKWASAAILLFNQVDFALPLAVCTCAAEKSAVNAGFFVPSVYVRFMGLDSIPTSTLPFRHSLRRCPQLPLIGPIGSV
uniref:Secreted protein n=1 Tax=Panagrellus redivivus TaxID=6233 RepID=A0A7E4W2E7_PANRE